MIEWIWFHSTWFYQAKWGDRVLLGWYGYQRKFAILFLFSKGHILCEWTIPCIGTVSRLNLVFVIWWKQHVLGYPLLSVCVCVISFEIYCIWPENGIHIAYVYITTFHFWSSDAKLPFKSSWNSPIFPIFFPSKCHPAIQLLHFNFPPLKLPVFEKEKFTPLKKNGKKTDTYDPPGWMGKPNVTAREWLSRSVLGMPCFPYTRWPVDCYPHGEPRSLEVERVSVTSCNCGQKIGHLSFFQKWNLLGKWMFLGKL